MRTTVGNILGSSLSNIGSLLRMPSGCGEQTMINFAPTVYVSKYLKGSGELTGEFKQKSQNFIQEGYQNELRFGCFFEISYHENLKQASHNY